MRERVLGVIRDWGRLVYLSGRLIAGRWWWAVPIIPLVWSGFLILRLLVGWRTEEYVPYAAQNQLIAVPLTILAIGLGVRIIAAELDSRTLEIAYTVPGGTRWVWLAKLTAAALMLAAAELLLAAVAAVFLTGFPVGMLYVPFQAAVFYLALSMALSALFKSEVTGALVSIPVLIIGLALSGTRPSPFFNTLLPEIADRADPSDILAWTIQNRVGFALVILAIVALAFARAERREQMMSG
jgi:ABC-type transport system involved in multi-copper enzyme maturation permease subunit